MNKDLIETPRFNFFIGDEVLLKGKIVGFDVDENKCVENVVRLEYGQTLNVPNNNIYITDDIVDKSKIKVVVPQFVADWIRKCKMFKHFAVSLSFALQPIVWEENGLSHECIEWLMDANNQELFARAWLDGYEVEKEKRCKCIKIPEEIRPFDIGYRIVNKYGQALALRNGASIFDLPFLAEKAIEKEFGKNDPDFDIGKHSVEEIAIVNLSKFHSYFEEVIHD
ncbi:Protein of uncharacterised function (DUF1642) [Streptococcus pneumoniae]|nr:Protein of uncharacterised function (DUF1642) [Streptococcus pneumoniae]CVY43139.1 Protein of uncharacterised function (DUF1642) [Streptococcus pneumoniae]CWE10608.1 Protein of uncharacterised function (DUF1642) [Streptococcus pneumoniae]CWF66504.1 Protein of uncharacterised function (DUF1642) [Streptococcus pneumoniae]